MQKSSQLLQLSFPFFLDCWYHLLHVASRSPFYDPVRIMQLAANNFIVKEI